MGAENLASPRILYHRWRVVTTLTATAGEDGEGDHPAIVRFSTTLMPGQEQIISLPMAAGASASALRIHCRGDRIEMDRIAAGRTSRAIGLKPLEGLGD